MSPLIRACNLVDVGGKPNKKSTYKKMCLFGGSPSIIRTIKIWKYKYYIYITCKRNGDVQIGNDMKHYKIDIKEWANETIVNNYSFC
jgi:hypothetical protein